MTARDADAGSAGNVGAGARPARRLLVLSYFFPPHAGGGVHRVLGFTRYLPAHGWECTVVCAGERDFWVHDPSLLKRIDPRTEVVRVPGGSAPAAWLRMRRNESGSRSQETFGVLRRLADWWLIPDPYIGWSARGRAAGERMLARGRFDAMLSSSPPDSVHLAAAALKQRFGLPWVADFRDPWMGLHHRTPPTAWHAGRQSALEQRVLERADVVLTATRAHADLLEGRSAGRAQRVVHLPNGFEPNDAAVAAEDVDPERFLIVFTGTLFRMPDAEIFLEALHEMLAHDPAARRRVRVRFAGPYETGYADRSIALGLTPGIVDFLGPIAHADTRALQRRADLLVLWKMERMEATVPGKLYEYLDSGRPLIALLADRDDAALLLERTAGERVAPGDRAGLIAALERHYAQWKDRGRAGAQRPEWLADHTRARLAGRLAAELDTVVGAGLRHPRRGIEHR